MVGDDIKINDQRSLLAVLAYVNMTIQNYSAPPGGKITKYDKGIIDALCSFMLWSNSILHVIKNLPEE